MPRTNTPALIAILGKLDIHYGTKNLHAAQILLLKRYFAQKHFFHSRLLRLLRQQHTSKLPANSLK